MALLDNREQRVLALTEDDFLKLIGLSLDESGDFPPDLSPREHMLRINPMFLQGDFRVYVPLNGKAHHSQVETDDADSMLSHNSVVKVGHRMIITACDGMFISFLPDSAGGTEYGVVLNFLGEKYTSLEFTSLEDNAEHGQAPLYFAKTFNWQSENIHADSHQAIIDVWEDLAKITVAQPQLTRILDSVSSVRS